MTSLDTGLDKIGNSAIIESAAVSEKSGPKESEKNHHTKWGNLRKPEKVGKREL